MSDVDAAEAMQRELASSLGLDEKEGESEEEDGDEKEEKQPRRQRRATANKVSHVHVQACTSCVTGCVFRCCFITCMHVFALQLGAAAPGFGGDGQLTVSSPDDTCRCVISQQPLTMLSPQSKVRHTAAAAARLHINMGRRLCCPDLVRVCMCVVVGVMCCVVCCVVLSCCNTRVCVCVSLL